LRRQSAISATGSAAMPSAIVTLVTRANSGSLTETTTSPSSIPAPNTNKAHLL
jgi:hypothetical protein